jgi:hypothetical protein
VTWSSVKQFLLEAFSENGQPSSSRIISAWLSVSSMALIWWCIRHAMALQDPIKIGAWISGLPQIILALAAFAVSPYGVNQLRAAVAAIRGQDTKSDAS